jgi:hypothetical protein
MLRLRKLRSSKGTELHTFDKGIYLPSLNWPWKNDLVFRLLHCSIVLIVYYWLLLRTYPETQLRGVKVTLDGEEVRW